MRAMTGAQVRLYEAILAYQQEKGVSPTYRELAAKLGVTRQACHYMVERMESSGHIKRMNKHGNRNIEVQDHGVTRT